MNRIFLITFISCFLFSCSTFVNLGDNETGSKNGDSLPEELSDSENYESESGNEGDTGNTGDAGNSGDTGDTGNTGDTGEMNDMADESVSDEDSYAVSDEDNSDAGTYPFDENFSTEDCGCGENPVYTPLCCDETISVFNKCFANCYNIHSDGLICVETADGVCDKIEQPDEEMTDNEISDNDTAVWTDEDDSDQPDETDNEFDDLDLSDADLPDNEFGDDSDFTETIDNECGCYPDDTELYCCYVNGTVLVSKCMADCICAGGYSACY